MVALRQLSGKHINPSQYDSLHCYKFTQFTYFIHDVFELIPDTAFQLRLVSHELLLVTFPSDLHFKLTASLYFAVVVFFFFF